VHAAHQRAALLDRIERLARVGRTTGHAQGERGQGAGLSNDFFNMQVSFKLFATGCSGRHRVATLAGNFVQAAHRLRHAAERLFQQLGRCGEV
jgi:hypothetical protein